MESREYQLRISEVASKANTLVVLPTGLEKTVIAILVAEKKLGERADGKIVVLAPTRPLVVQHHSAFSNHFTKSICNHLTGQIPPDKRQKVWAESNFIFATPQVIANDVRAGRYGFSDVCLMVFNEAHRCVKDYDYTQLALKYQQSAAKPLILGLTASPGGKHRSLIKAEKMTTLRWIVERVIKKRIQTIQTIPVVNQDSKLPRLVTSGHPSSKLP